MKAIISALAAALMTAGVTFAQNTDRLDYPAGNRERYTPEQVAQRRTEDLAQKLSLTEQQRDEVYNLFLEQAEGMQQQREKARQARIRRQEAITAHRNKCAAQMKTILTPEQYTEWLQLQSERCPDCDDTGRPRHHVNMRRPINR